jgi:hypothetical protein
VLFRSKKNKNKKYWMCRKKQTNKQTNKQIMDGYGCMYDAWITTMYKKINQNNILFLLIMMMMMILMTYSTCSSKQICTWCTHTHTHTHTCVRALIKCDVMYRVGDPTFTRRPLMVFVNTDQRSTTCRRITMFQYQRNTTIFNLMEKHPC